MQNGPSLDALAFPKALQVLGQVEDIDLVVRENDPFAYHGVTQAARWAG